MRFSWLRPNFFVYFTYMNTLPRGGCRFWFWLHFYALQTVSATLMLNGVIAAPNLLQYAPIRSARCSSAMELFGPEAAVCGRLPIPEKPGTQTSPSRQTPFWIRTFASKRCTACSNDRAMIFFIPLTAGLAGFEPQPFPKVQML